MALDFQQVRQQVKRLGESALARQQVLQEQRQRAYDLLQSQVHNLQALRDKVGLVVRQFDPSLRCALPVQELLDTHGAMPDLPAQATILAADGSQIAPDRHAQVNYCLINVGAIHMHHGSAKTPELQVESRLYYEDDEIFQPSGTVSDARLALLRDVRERSALVEMAQKATPPVISFTDGPMELWGAKDGDGATEFQRQLAQYLEVLRQLNALGVVTAGYVDKPAANLVVRLLEVALLPQEDLPHIRDLYPLHGVTDVYLFRRLLGPGERSAVFAVQSQSAAQYRQELALHFFYLNVARPGGEGLARVEIPAWVASNARMLDDLHATLIKQCQIMGARPYPYLLHRAHEAAVVSLEEKEQVTQMIVLELRRRGAEVGEISHKQAAKNLGGRTRYGS